MTKNLVEHLFEANTGRPGDFIVGPGSPVSFETLLERVSQLSCYLRERFQPGERIGVLADNSEFFVFAYLSVLKSGCVAVMLDCNANQDKIDDEITRTKPQGIFSREKFKHKLDGVDVPLMSEQVLAESETMDRQAMADSFVGGGDDLAVIFFTSGTMAKRKGVMLSHANLIANTDSIVQYLELTDKDRSCLILPLHYAGGTAVLHTHLRAGGSIVLFNTTLAGTIIENIKKFSCTNMSGVPTTYSILLRRGGFLRHSYPSLRFVAQAGGAMATSMIEDIRDNLKDTDLFVMYGQTEASARLSYLPPDKLKTKIGSIGRGIPGMELRVVDQDMNPVAPGIGGELIARGASIMLGYLDDPEATDKVLKNGWLHTHDRAVIDEDGFIYVQGRMDDVIKSAGHRISPEEIENLVLSHPLVTQCGAFGAKDEFLGEAIVLIVESTESEPALVSELKTFCRKTLPAHMNPKYYKVLPSLPLNSSLKLDRARLRKLAAEFSAQE